MTSPSAPPLAHPASFRGWPALLGLVAGVGIGLGNAVGVPAVILVCAAIYVLAAATARPGSAWIAFAASIPIIAVGRIADAPWLAVLLAGVAAIVLVVVGAVRGSWRAADRVRQLPALLLFAALALTALLVSPPWLAAGVAAVALIAHAGWDIAHHGRREVVSPAYAEFCAVLDLALAAVLIVLAVVRGGA